MGINVIITICAKSKDYPDHIKCFPENIKTYENHLELIFYCIIRNLLWNWNSDWFFQRGGLCNGIRYQEQCFS